MEKIIFKALEDLKTSLKEDELAYLALTSKVENPLRDRIAYNIFNQIGKNHLVCREWRGNFKEEGKRHATDLAILKKGNDKNEEPIVLIEFKAQSVPIYTEEYSRHMKHDLEYLEMKAGDKTKLYYIQFTNLFENQYLNLSKDKKALHKSIYESVKYFEKINRSIKKGKNNLESVIIEKWKNHLKDNKIEDKFEKCIKIDGGEYLGHKVSVIAQILGPLYKKELIKLKDKWNEI